MDRLERIVARCGLVLAAAVLLCMMGQIVADVLLRNLLGTGLPATAEMVSHYYMVAISFLPLAATQIARRHIEATIFTEQLRGRSRQAVALLGTGIALVVFGLLTYGSAMEAARHAARGSYVQAGLLHFPTWPSYWILPLAFALMVLALLLTAKKRLKGRDRSAPGAEAEAI